MQTFPSDPGERQQGRQHGERDYKAFDQVLDLIRHCFATLHIGFAKEERWRWDTPVINISWDNGTEQISRNINGLVLGEMSPNGVQIESNAWYDVREGTHLRRYWRNFPAGRIDSTDKESVCELVKTAYEEVSGLSKNQIERFTELPN